jgi:hypothetical protein
LVGLRELLKTNGNAREELLVKIVNIIELCVGLKLFFLVNGVVAFGGLNIFSLLSWMKQ